MNEERFWVLWAKFRCDELSETEKQELQQLAAANPDNQQAIHVLDALLNAPIRAYPDEQLRPDHWQQLEKQLGDEATVIYLPAARRKRRWLLAACTIGLIGLLLGARYYLFTRTREILAVEMTNRVITEPDSKSQIELPDGTTVWLNKRSKLSYSSEQFGTNQREVILVGEAFFDVKKNASVPFIIHANAINITVKGTAFNVKAYPESRTLETSLVRGLIEINTLKDPDRKILLKPNEKFILSLDKEQELPVGKASLEKEPAGFQSYVVKRLEAKPGISPDETSWMNQELVFNDESLEALAPKLESWYNIRISVNNDELKKRRFSGVVRKESLNELLKLLQLTYPFSYLQQGDELILDIPSPKKSIMVR